MAASILQRHGFQDVYNIPGSISAWTSADFPLE
jgi:rhodanese-related sulfurtransferase